MQTEFVGIISIDIITLLCIHFLFAYNMVSFLFV